MNKREMAKIYQQLSKNKITQIEAIREIDQFLSILEEALLEHGKVKFMEKGVFEILERKPRRIANPNTKEPLIIYPQKTVKFKLSSFLKEKA